MEACLRKRPSLCHGYTSAGQEIPQQICRCDNHWDAGGLARHHVVIVGFGVQQAAHIQPFLGNYIIEEAIRIVSTDAPEE
jgi:hypothetical protein